MMEKYNALLSEVKDKKAAYKERYKHKNRTEAFDFNVLDFFKVGENRISAFLNFFLDPKGSHGQGDVFLQAFLNHLEIEIPTEKLLEIRCEKIIDGKRRIDLFMQFENKVIAIENKLWAKDQDQQLADYDTYLKKRFSKEYTLIYLNPYGSSPSLVSVAKAHKEELIKSGRLKILSYTDFMIPLLTVWQQQCKARRVRFFICELKTYFEHNFLGTKSNAMTSELKDVIYSNRNEVVELVSAYQAIVQLVLIKHNKCSELLKQNEKNYNVPEGVELKFIEPFSYNGYMVSKFKINRGTNEIFIQLVQDNILLTPSHYYSDGIDPILEKEIEDLKLECKKDFSRLEEGEAVNEIESQVNKVLRLLEKY